MSEVDFVGRYPTTRMRRLRQQPWSRALAAENALSPSDLIWPIFIREGRGEREPVAAMPGVDRLSVDLAAKAAGDAKSVGIPVIAIFPVTPAAQKSADGAEASNPDNLTCQAVKAIKDAHPDIGVMCDAALDPYTDHGHDGILEGETILNDESVEVLVAQSLVQAEAGCDIISPSDMMDGRIGAIRSALDEAGRSDVLIMSYAAKYASAFYGPFREAIGTDVALRGDKKTYQMDPANTDEALREVALDVAEGADMVMVKPGLPYLDIVRRVKQRFGLPTFAYQVSGEYAMLQAAANNGWLDGDRAIAEALMCFKRAGCDGILTYFALEMARRLQD